MLVLVVVLIVIIVLVVIIAVIIIIVAIVIIVILVLVVVSVLVVHGFHPSFKISINIFYKNIQEYHMQLPVEFENRMKDVLKEDFNRFLTEYEHSPYRALRINTLKSDAEKLMEIFEFLKIPTDFCDDSYYLPQEFQKPGNHPLHHAGAYYIQEPSASSVVEAIGIREGDRVLDLCASPGGKTTQAAAKLCGKGVIVSNEFVSSRVQPLVSNIERMGIPNAVVTSAHPDEICPKFEGFFNRVIVDAPCSGEGMFRKELSAVQDWSVANVKTCAERQLKILNSASKNVASGGKLVYSTCTYSPEENEMTVAKFLEENRDFRLVKPEKEFGRPAIARFAPNTENLEYARRIFNFDGGEGHFVAVMQRDGEEQTPKAINLDLRTKGTTYDCFKNFFVENFCDDVPKNVLIENGKVYIIPQFEEIISIKAVRKGIFAGVEKNGRFIPEHALFNTPFLTAKRTILLSIDDVLVKKFLHGEEISCDVSLKGYVQVMVEGVPLGFGKASDGRLKNHYPKGLRILN